MEKAKFTLPEPSQTPYKSRREELFDQLIKGINGDREKAGFRPMSVKSIAIAVNINPFLKSDDGELEYLIKECQKQGSFKKAYWTLFPKKP